MRKLFWSLVFLLLNFFFIIDVDSSHSKGYVFILLGLSLPLIYKQAARFSGVLILASLLPVLCLFDIYNYWAFYQTLCFFSGFLFFIFLFTNKVDHEMFRAALVGTCFINSLSILVNTFGYDIYNLIGLGMPVQNLPGLMGNRGFTGCVIASTLPFVFESEKWIKYSTLCVALISLFLISIFGTDTPLLTVITFLIVRKLSFLNCRPVFLYTGATSILFSFSDEIRWMTWIKALGQLNWHGKGFGFVASYASSIFAWTDTSGLYSLHNEPLELLLSLGVFAFPAFLVLLKGLTREKGAHFHSLSITLLLSVSWPAYHVPMVALVGLYSLSTILKGRHNVRFFEKGKEGKLYRRRAGAIH